MSEYKNILIARIDRIGDVVLTLPMVNIIKEFYPEAKITFLVREYTKSIVEHNNNIDEILIAKMKDGKFSIKDNLNEISKRNFDAAFVVYPTFELAYTIFKSKIPVRIGSGYRWYSLLFNKRIYEHRKYGKKHELEHNVEMLKAIGITKNISKENVDFNIHVEIESEQNVIDKLESLNVDLSKPNIVVHPGSGGSAVDWPIECYKTFVKVLAHQLDCNIFITGSLEEFGLCQELIQSDNIYNLAGVFNLKEFTALLGFAELVVTNSTGPIHIAGALKRNIIGFYPNIPSCSPKRWEPYCTTAKIFTPEVDETVKKDLYSKAKLMTNIKPETVLNEACKIISNC